MDPSRSKEESLVWLHKPSGSTAASPQLAAEGNGFTRCLKEGSEWALEEGKFGFESRKLELGAKWCLSYPGPIFPQTGGPGRESNKGGRCQDGSHCPGGEFPGWKEKPGWLFSKARLWGWRDKSRAVSRRIPEPMGGDICISMLLGPSLDLPEPREVEGKR